MMSLEFLSISPDCADAYNLLAEEEAKTLEEAKDLYQKGMEAGRRAIDDLEYFCSSGSVVISKIRTTISSCGGTYA